MLCQPGQDVVSDTNSPITVAFYFFTDWNHGHFRVVKALGYL